MKTLTAILLGLYVPICLYMDRCYGDLTVNGYYTLLQLSILILCVVLTLWLNGWLKVAAFAITALTFVELCQQVINGNTQVTIGDNAALIIVVLSVVGFILMRRYKNVL
jgi:hypothetical protein